MLNFDDIIQYYPPRTRAFRENILKEYLQIRILEIIYSSSLADKLVFLGGTAIRIVHQGSRFSEDLDFDNVGLEQDKFEVVTRLIEKNLTLDGYTVEIKNVYKGAWHCYISFPGLLFQQGMTGHKQERILIQIDAEPQEFTYSPVKFLINRFGFYRYINTVPADLLLSQKIYACLNRKRAKGRDFFDVVYLMSRAKPDYTYLKIKAGISDKNEMIRALRIRAQTVNLNTLANDVEPFLEDSAQKNRVDNFEQWLDSLGE